MATSAMPRQAAPVANGYFYGDSTPSPLRFDFIGFLRDAFDFAVAVLQCDARMTDALHRAEQLAEATDREIARAEAFAADISAAIDRSVAPGHESLVARCATRIRQGVSDLVRSEADGARAVVAAERAKATQAIAEEREACVRALETLLLRHDLPESVLRIRLRLESPGQYAAQLQARTPYGLDCLLSLQTPPSHAFAHVLRVDRIFERLEIEAPEEAGWLRKETKLRAQRLDRLHVIEVTVDPTETWLKLRAGADGSGPGFDLAFPGEDGSVQLVRVAEGSSTPDAPYEVAGDDAATLRAFEREVVTLARSLLDHKKSLVEASLDDTPIGRIDAPSLVVERLIENIAPSVREIAKRSLAPGELVLKRRLSDNHREELFVSKSELVQKLSPLPTALRRFFDPLELWETAPPAPAPMASRPEPAPASPVSSGGAAAAAALARTSNAPPRP